MAFREKTKTFVKTYGFSSLGLMILVLLSRLVAMYWIPLNDSTEARYAEIARLMLVNHNWVSLMHYPGQYFWAKPPLSTWLSAVSMSALGISPFMARLPAWILSWLCLAMLAKMAASQYGIKASYWAMGVLVTSIYFLLDAGTVMTDPVLMTCVLMLMLSFWQALHHPSIFWKYAIFVSWGLGLLAKGLVMAVFTVLPILTWLIINRYFLKAWRAIPWISGSCLTLLIALPWFILAELRTPGFLNYFFIGEHVMRFLKPGWAGDMYGYAHQAPIGMIWIYFFLGAMPWSLCLFIWSFKYKKLWSFSKTEFAWFSYLLSFVLSPLIFFSFARNIIYPYVFPVLPAFALLFTSFLFKLNLDKNFARLFRPAAVVLIIVSLASSWMFQRFPVQISKSNNLMIAAWQTHRHSAQEKLIYLMNKPEYSSMFYSDGTVVATRDPKLVCELLKQGPIYVVTNSDEPTGFGESLAAVSTPIYVQQHRSRYDRLYRLDGQAAFCQI